MEVCKQKTAGLPSVGGEGVEFCGGAVVIRVRRATHVHRVGSLERLLGAGPIGQSCILQPWGTAAFYAWVVETREYSGTERIFL
jgi:hypothetical protein